MTKLDNYFFVFVVRQTFLGFEMPSNFRDTSPLNLGNNKITNVANPVKALDGVNKRYFEDILAKSHLISSRKTSPL